MNQIETVIISQSYRATEAIVVEPVSQVQSDVIFIFIFNVVLLDLFILHFCLLKCFFLYLIIFYLIEK